MSRNVGFSKMFTKIITLFTTLMVTLGFLMPNVTVVNAAGTLQIAQYISNSGTVSGVTGSNNGTYNGTWTADVPIADVMSELAPYMTTYVIFTLGISMELVVKLLVSNTVLHSLRKRLLALQQLRVHQQLFQEQQLRIPFQEM